VSWDVIDEPRGLYSIEHLPKNGFSLRTTALRLSSGGLLVLSPTRNLGDVAHAALARHGKPDVLLATNHYHHLGLDEWKQRFPDAKVVASEGARNRVAGKHRALTVEDADDVVRERLPPHASLMCPPGLKNGEVWLRVETGAGVAWAVTDAFFNMPVSPRGLAGLFLRMTSTVPGLCLGSTFRWVGVRDRDTYRAWLLERIAHDKPRILIPAHGAVVVNDAELPEKLTDLAHTRLS
jgi:hypothetical protein